MATCAPPLADGLISDPRAAAAIAFAYTGPPRMRAGALERWTFRFTPRADLPRGARIGIAHRWPNDWGNAQASDPQREDYLGVRADASVRWWNARLHTWHPFDHVLFVELSEGLTEGGSVELRYGDAAGGSPGYRVQTFLEEASPFSLRWQAERDGPWVEFARHTLVVVGAEPARLALVAPSQVAAGKPFELHVRVEDAWGNPAHLDEPVEVSGIVAPIDVPATGWVRVQRALDVAGIERIEASSRGARSLSAMSNPIEVLAEPPRERLFWGDLHGQSVIGCGARSIDAYYAHARDFAPADVASHQANCFLVTNAQWHETEASTARHHAPHRFVTLLGVEWSASTSLGGDHNLYFPGDEAPLRRCSHQFIADKSDVDTDLPHVEDLYRHYRESDTLIAVHVGGRTANLGWHEPALDRLLEVHSTHATSEWFLFDALRRGYRMAVVAGSDGVDGRPANSHPGHMGVRNLRGGLTAIAASELTREAIWKALKQRRCYATTGERILLDFRAGTARMGDAIEMRGALPQFEVRVEGTAPLERIDFFRGTECLRSIDRFAESPKLSNRIRIAWQGLSAQGNWQRARMVWDGELRVEGARILGVDGWAFDTPDEGLVEYDDRRVQWRSVTAGDWDGVVIALDRPETAEITFVSEPITLRTRLAGLDGAARRFDVADPQRSLELRRLPESMPSASFRGSFADRDAPRGEHAYWVRVRQADGACAWSTPIFVTLAT